MRDIFRARRRSDHGSWWTKEGRVALQVSVCVGRLAIIVVVDGLSGILCPPCKTRMRVEGRVAGDRAVVVTEEGETGN